MSSGRMPEERFSYRIVSSTVHNALHLLRRGGRCKFSFDSISKKKEEERKRKEKKGLESFSRSDTLPVPDRFKDSRSWDCESDCKVSLSDVFLSIVLATERMGHCYANVSKADSPRSAPGVEQRSARGRITGFQKMTWLKSENLSQKERSCGRRIRNLGRKRFERNSRVLASSNSK